MMVRRKNAFLARIIHEASAASVDTRHDGQSRRLGVPVSLRVRELSRRIFMNNVG